MNDADRGSRLPGWHRLGREARVSHLAGWIGSTADDVAAAVDSGGLETAAAEVMVENVIGTYALPFAVATNFRINGTDVLVPMAIEEPSVVAAAGNAARMIREGGGFRVEVEEPIMVCQIQVFVEDTAAAKRAVLDAGAEVLDAAARCDETLTGLGGGPRDVEVREFHDDVTGEDFIAVHLAVDVRDAMGANTVNTMGEAVAPLLERVTGGRAGLRILTNLADRRLVRVECSIPPPMLELGGYSHADVLDAVTSASRFASLDPYRAATHNKGIMNGTDAVLMATGNDWRAVEAGAHAWAALGGKYGPLSTWNRGEGDTLEGRLEMPMAVGIVGGTTRKHPGARLALRILRAADAAGVAQAAAAAGMANNLAALRALATEGIQRGHMRLHERSRGIQG